MTKEIISRFREKPKTKTAWRAMYFGLAAILAIPFIGIFAAVIRPIIDKASNESIGAIIGFGTGIIVLTLAVLALVFGISAFRKGGRSWVLWIGLAPAILTGAFWIFMIVGEFIFPH